MKLSIVIVSYNVKYYLEQCLCSVIRACYGLDAEIWVVDNASSDGSVEYIRSRFPDVHFIENQENVGFSRANNMAIRQATGEYILLLNPDTVVGENTLSGCLHFMDTHTEAGATGVAMLKDDGGFAWESRRGLFVWCAVLHLIKPDFWMRIFSCMEKISTSLIVYYNVAIKIIISR